MAAINPNNNSATRLRADILTIFPEFFDSPFNTSILKRAIQANLIECHRHDIRAYSTDKHRCVDDTPYGGGGGMVMMAQPLLDAIRAVRKLADASVAERNCDVPAGYKTPVVYMSPQGEVLTSELVDELAMLPSMILLCGNYEGVDERVIELEVDREISIGDYVLTGGEPAALVVLNAVARHIEGVLGNPDSAPNDSFETGLLDFPHYTKPVEIEGLPVPEVLLGGHHAQIMAWRREQQILRTAERRPDLLPISELTGREIARLRKAGLWPEEPTP